MINLTFPDGSVRSFESGITGLEVANFISKSLAKKATAIRLNDILVDLSHQIQQDCSVKIVTNDSGDDDCLEVIRHDSAHILAQAIKEIYGSDVQITIGPVIENGFYYDIASKHTISIDQFPDIEAKMQEISSKNYPVIREIWSREKAIQYFQSIGEVYKAEIISDLPENEDISIYKQGDFIDLCRGPHAPFTGLTKHYKLLKIAGAYWRGDSKNQMLQRIYGTAWHSKQALENYLFMLEEAEKRDHRKLGQEMDLFHIQEEAPGSIFWHPKGWELYLQVENYIRTQTRQNGYSEVKTPQMVDKILWEKSGHWEKFRDDMFVCETEDKTFAIKPMSCPCHIQIFNRNLISYKDLPLRLSEFGTCHRNESSGALHGLMRVRSMNQDDGHIFCTKEQIESETMAFCKMLFEVYAKFGFNKVDIKFSTRPEVRAGSDETWDLAEEMLASAITKCGYNYELQPGEGAFYGPKLEFQLQDAIGRKWQCGTLQLDFVLPERLNAKFINNLGEKETPVMLHRAILGSMERFIGILIENYAGRFPTWLAPVQIALVTISSQFDAYAKDIASKMQQAGIRIKLDLEGATLNYKIRHHMTSKVPILGIIGKNEVENGEITIRRLGSEENKTYKFEEFFALLKLEAQI